MQLIARRIAGMLLQGCAPAAKLQVTWLCAVANLLVAHDTPAEKLEKHGI